MTADIGSQLRSAAQKRRIRIKGEAKAVALVAGASSPGEEVLDVFAAAQDAKQYLVITSAGVHEVRPGTFGGGKITSIPIGQIEEVKAMQGRFDQAIFRRLDVGGAGQSISLQFVFLIPYPHTHLLDEQTLQIGEQLLGEAVDQIEDLRRAHQDPDLAAFHRSMALADAGPQPGSLDPSAMTADEAATTVVWMNQALQQGAREQVWEHRVALGYGVPLDRLAPSDRYWINALPAQAALDLGLRDHPMVAMCAGLAEQSIDRASPDQVAFQQQIEGRFFG